MSDHFDRTLAPVPAGPPGAASLTFTHPDDVLDHPALSTAEKREILADWASDAHAVPDFPALRQLDSGAIVPVDAVLEALRSLDAEPARPRSTLWAAPLRRPRILSARWRRSFGFHRHDNDDDDPPPAPASALPPGIELELRRRRDAEWAAAAA